MGSGFTLYNLVLLLHIAAVVVGFGSSFVYPMLAVKARQMEPKQSFALNQAVASLTKPLTFYPVVAAGVLGLLLVLLSDQAWTFKQGWVSIAFLLFFAAVGGLWFAEIPNQQAMVALQDKLVNGTTKSGAGGPPPEVAELAERGKKAAMYNGIGHLLWLLLMLDMVFKPFL